MSLQQNLEQETVSQLNLREAITISPDKTIRDAVEEMRKKKLGCVVVIDNERKPIGLYTEAMLRVAICREPESLDAVLSEQMATTFPWVTKDDPIETVMGAMETKNHRFVVVVDESGRVAGLTGQKGLMEYVAEHFSEEVMVQRVGSAPYPHQREGA